MEDYHVTSKTPARSTSDKKPSGLPAAQAEINDESDEDAEWFQMQEATEETYGEDTEDMNWKTSNISSTIVTIGSEEMIETANKEDSDQIDFTNKDIDDQQEGG